MYRELSVQKDRDRLLTYFREEQTAPKWYRESNDMLDMTDTEFLNFCSRYRIYEINESALFYFQFIKDNALIHFSKLRGTPNDYEDDLKKIRRELFNKVTVIYGWVLRQNIPMKRLCRTMGMEFNGWVWPVEGTRLKRECFSMHRMQSFYGFLGTSLLESN